MTPDAVRDAGREDAILFELAGTRYALPSRSVRHVEMLDQLTPVPNAPPWVAGIVFSRGAVIPAVDLRRRFGHPAAPPDPRTRLIVVEHAGRTLGLIVDVAREFRSIPADTLVPPGQSLPAGLGSLLDGVATIEGRLVLLVSVAALVEGLSLAAATRAEAT